MLMAAYSQHAVTLNVLINTVRKLPPPPHHHHHCYYVILLVMLCCAVTYLT